MSRTRKVGFFGGSFDPIHLGHLNLAIHMLEQGGVDEILFCPAKCSPFKTKSPPIASDKHRLAMLELVLEPYFRVTSLELDREGTSFTIDTLRLLPKEHVSYRLILSEESAGELSKWKEVNEVIRLAPPLVGSREGGGKTQFQTIHTPRFDISSHEIRARLQKKMYCKHLLPSIVLDYIEQYQVYSQP